jgi:hypothetical protein
VANIRIADGDDAVQQITKILLQRSGHQVTGARLTAIAITLEIRNGVMRGCV